MKRGFTLLEVVAAVAVVGILASIAIVSSSSIRGGVQDRAAEAALERVVSAQRAHAAANGVWAESSQLAAAGLTLTENVSDSPAVVSITRGPDMSVGLAVLSDSGTCKAVVLTDPLQEGQPIAAEIGPRSPCSGGGALASIP